MSSLYDSLSHEIISNARLVLELEKNGIERLSETLGEEFVAAVKLILSVKGRLIISGLGKSGHIAAKIAATMSSTGTPAHFVHAAEAAHGDMGMITRFDAVLLISNSGETAELLPIIQYAAKQRIPLIGISSTPESTLARNANISILLPKMPEACPVGIAPTTSTTMTLALGDALSMVVMKSRGFTKDDFKQFHPGGSIGLRLMKVCEFMHRGDRLPLVEQDAPIKDVILTMTSKSFGIAGVVDEHGYLVGAISDGDLRRHFNEISNCTARDIMNGDPRAIPQDMAAEDALIALHKYKVTALFVIEDACNESEVKPVGIVNVHDFLRLGLN